MSSLPKPTLANWRQHPFNVRGFVEVDRIVASQPIKAGPNAQPLPKGAPLDLDTIRLDEGSAAELLAALHPLC